jgi:hypothetical protein
MMPEGYTIDESAFPLVVSTFRGPATMERAKAYFARLDVWCRDGRRFATILDVSGGGVPTPAHRKLIVDSLAPRRAILAKQCLGLAVVITNPLIRGATTAVLWMHPPVHPVTIVATLAEARAACTKWFANDRATAA